ncbi:DUF924 family protein [Haliea sp.]
METPDTIVQFWFGDSDDDAAVASNCAGLWWSKNPETDSSIRERFEPAVQAVAASELDHWRRSGEGWLALIILTDQFPRNIYRGTPDAFRYDPIARQLCEEGLAAAADQQLRPIQRVFFYLPLEHSEYQAHQVRSVELFRELAASAPAGAQAAFDRFYDFAQRHKAVVDRFGRFPHRNEILGRPSTQEEIAFLREPGSSF